MDTKEITVSDLAQEQIKNAERLFPLIRKKTEERKAEGGADLRAFYSAHAERRHCAEHRLMLLYTLFLRELRQCACVI